MGTPATRAVVLLRFPYSDLSSSKLRSALLLGNAGRGDWVLCQITSNPYADPSAIRLEDADFDEGGLQRTSYIRPNKLFTANEALFQAIAGVVDANVHRRTVAALIELLQGPASAGA